MWSATRIRAALPRGEQTLGMPHCRDSGQTHSSPARQGPGVARGARRHPALSGDGGWLLPSRPCPSGAPPRLWTLDAIERSFDRHEVAPSRRCLTACTGRPPGAGESGSSRRRHARPPRRRLVAMAVTPDGQHIISGAGRRQGVERRQQGPCGDCAGTPTPVADPDGRHPRGGATTVHDLGALEPFTCTAAYARRCPTTGARSPPPRHRQALQRQRRRAAQLLHHEAGCALRAAARQPPPWAGVDGGSHRRAQPRAQA